jgi:hypothetical protein
MKNNIIKSLLMDFFTSSDKLNRAYHNDDITIEEYGATLEAIIANYDLKIREQIRKGNI